jgi:hypothetical protein
MVRKSAPRRLGSESLDSPVLCFFGSSTSPHPFSPLQDLTSNQYKRTEKKTSIITGSPVLYLRPSQLSLFFFWFSPIYRVIKKDCLSWQYN